MALCAMNFKTATNKINDGTRLEFVNNHIYIYIYIIFIYYKFDR